MVVAVEDMVLLKADYLASGKSLRVLENVNLRGSLLIIGVRHLSSH